MAGAQATNSLWLKVLRADAAGPMAQRIYDNTHIMLAGLVPLAIFSKDGSTMQRINDVALGLAIPLHSHVAMNSVLSDYMPKIGGKGALRASRYGALGLSGVTALGLLKLNLLGPGITPTVKQLWRKQPAAKA